ATSSLSTAMPATGAIWSPFFYSAAGASWRSIMRRECDCARTARAIAPRMVGAALHHRIASLEMHLLHIEDQRNLPFKNKAEVQGPRPLHVRMRRFRRIGRSRWRSHNVKIGFNLFRADLASKDVIGWKADDAAYGAATRRLDGMRRLNAV